MSQSVTRQVLHPQMSRPVFDGHLTGNAQILRPMWLTRHTYQFNVMGSCHGVALRGLPPPAPHVLRISHDAQWLLYDAFPEQGGRVLDVAYLVRCYTLVH
jgi:hypothetical protein